GVVALGTVAGHARPRGTAGPPVVYEDVAGTVGVPRYQVGRGREVGHEPAVRADRRDVTTRAVGLLAPAGHGHPAGDPGAAVADEHVVEAVGVARYQVGRRWAVWHVTAVRAGHRGGARAVGRGTPGGDTDPAGDPGRPVVPEDVVDAVGVVRYQVRRRARVCHEPAVRADHRGVTGSVGWRTHGGDADPGGDRGRAVVDEDIVDAVGVVRYQ